jgi:hypothetical protein
MFSGRYGLRSGECSSSRTAIFTARCRINNPVVISTTPGLKLTSAVKGEIEKDSSIGDLDDLAASQRVVFIR